MKNNLRITALILVVLLFSSCLAGCVSVAPPAADADTSEQAEAPETSVTVEKHDKDTMDAKDYSITIDIDQTRVLNNLVPFLRPMSEYVYKSENPSVATVDDLGVITGVSYGSTVVAVYLESELYLTVNVKVAKLTTPPTGTFIPYDNNAVIDEGEAYDLPAQSYCTMDKAVLRFESINTTVASVNEAGVILGIHEGSTTIIISYVFEEEEFGMGAFPVTVRAPWKPTDPDSLAVLKAKEELTVITELSWFNVNIASTPAYNPDGLKDTTAGPVEIWQDKLYMMPILSNGEWNDYGASDISEYRFKLYYRPYDKENRRGDYKLANITAFSAYHLEDSILCRCYFYDELYVKGNLEVGQEYEVVLVICKGDTALGYAESHFTWTDSCEAFVKVAESTPGITR